MSRVEAGQVDDALSILRTLVQRTPADGHAHALLGVCHAQQGNLDAAVKSLETAALLNPGDPAVEYNLACGLFQVGRLDQAQWRVNRLLENDPRHEDAKALLTHVQHARAVATAKASGAGALQPSAPAPRAAAPQRTVGRPQPSQRPDELLTGHPGIGCRLLRGLGWGLLYCQVWTVVSLLGAVVASLFTTKVEHAIVAFLVLGLMTTLFHSAMGLLTGVLVAVLNADEDAGAWVGMSVGFLILLCGLFAGMLAMWAGVFYLFVGRWIGRSVAERVQKPVAA
jgi:hypothetical protein